MLIRRPRGNNVLYQIRRANMNEVCAQATPPASWMKQVVRCVRCGEEHNVTCPIRDAIATNCPHCKAQNSCVGVPIRFDDRFLDKT